MIGHSGSQAISGWSLSLVLLFLLQPLWGSGGGGVLSLEEETGRIMDEISVEHQEALDLLKIVLAMDVQWSAFWSEKLNPNLVEDADLTPEFCPSLPEFENKPINTISAVKKIMKHCSHSGMYVDFAVKMLALSVQCMFNRHARLQLAAIKRLPFEAINEFTEHLGRLVRDYQMMANPLASIGAELHPLVALSRFFNDVQRQWVTHIENNRNEKNYRETIEREAGRLANLLNESSDYCAMSPKNWHGIDSKDTVILDMNTIEPMFSDDVTDDSLTSTLQNHVVLKEPSVRKAHKLRLILLKEFEKLHLGKLPQEVWNLMFEHNILVRQIQSKKQPNIIHRNLKKIKSKIFRK